MTNFAALYDSCVLYPAPLRDLLMHLAITDLYRAKWTNEIHEEWITSVLSDRKDLIRVSAFFAVCECSARKPQITDKKLFYCCP